MSDRLVVFALGEQRYALPLSAVERIVRAVAVTSLPQAPDIVLGIVNVQGQVTPVINLRRRFRLAEHEIDLSDQLVIARTVRRTVALVVDAVIGVLEYAEQEIVEGQDLLPELRYVEGVAKFDDGLILIHNLDKLLSLEEETVLQQALESA